MNMRFFSDTLGNYSVGYFVLSSMILENLLQVCHGDKDVESV
jgi:hypothetical protein